MAMCKSAADNFICRPTDDGDRRRTWAMIAKADGRDDVFEGRWKINSSTLVHFFVAYTAASADAKINTDYGRPDLDRISIIQYVNPSLVPIIWSRLAVNEIYLVSRR